MNAGSTTPQGGNAVLGYQQSFDLSAESGQIVARAVGTACRIRPKDRCVGRRTGKMYSGAKTSMPPLPHCHCAFVFLA